LREALERYLPIVENWLGEAPLNDQWRKERGKPPRREELMNSVLGLPAFIQAIGKPSVFAPPTHLE
jgi:hypothetical protein